ncbi:YscW family type III secretion system pilotin, partial [Aeromonas sp. QDB22]
CMETRLDHRRSACSNFINKVRSRPGYEVTMLPLQFDLRLTPLQLAEGNIYVRARLRFIDSAAVQAMRQQKVFKVFNGEKMVIQLQPRSCYPQCQ